MEDLTLIMVYQDSMPWLKLALESLSHFKNKQAIDYVFVENLPQNDDGTVHVQKFIGQHGGTLLTTTPPPSTDSRAHAHGLNYAFKDVRTEWTLFMDADTILLKDGWLDTMMVTGADMIGPIPDSGIADFSLPILHPCLLLFRSKLARKPYWDEFFGRWNKAQTIDGSDWDTCRPFTYNIGIRTDVKQAKLANMYVKNEYGIYFLIGTPDCGLHHKINNDQSVLAMHLREGSKAMARHRYDDRYMAMRKEPHLAWYRGDISQPYNPWKK